MDIRTVSRRFMALNSDRLRRVQQSLLWRQRDFLDLLPLLFHVNHPLLPGYVSADTPCGLSDYQPTKAALEAMRRLAKSFTYKRQGIAKCDIFSIFFTGSSGSVAYSAKSDFDIWVCHSPTLNAAQRDELQQKAEAIGKWAAQLGLEAHFFIMDEERFRSGEHGRVTEESSGSAQHHLLLEEFYRTGLLLSGRYPIWWLVPPEHERHYEEYVAELRHKRFIRESETVDFGGLSSIPAEEFFGASLWQIYKGIDSPYKSVLKILLMEAYASEYPDIELLSLRLKKKVYGRRVELNEVDPYISVCSKIDEYLRGSRQSKRLEFMRQCLYFKVGLKLSAGPAPGVKRQYDWRRELMEDLVEKWGWDQTHLMMLDARDSWKIDQVMEERNTIVSEFTHSYQQLSGFARRFSSLSSINQRDMTILGRKLYAAFERKAGKVDIVNTDINPNLVETHFTLQQIVRPDAGTSWVLYRGNVDPLDPPAPALRRARGVVELLAWCHFNNLANSSTVFVLHAESSGTSQKELSQIVRSFERAFPDSLKKELQLDALAQPARLLSVALFVNVGLDPLASHTRRGQHLISERSDALSYSGMLENLILSVDEVSISSWNEVFTNHFDGIDGVMTCLCNYVNAQASSYNSAVTPVQAFSFSSSLDPTIAMRMEKLFQSVADCYLGKGSSAATRYVVGVQGGFSVLQPKNGQLRHHPVQDYDALLTHLAEPQPCYSPILFDEHAVTDSALPMVCERNKEGIVQMYYWVVKSRVLVYVLDERGSLFSQVLPFHSVDTLLNQFSLFIGSAMKRQNLLQQRNASALPPIRGIEFNRIEKLSRSKWKVARQNYDPRTPAADYFKVQAIAEEHSAAKAHYTIYCGAREFSTLEHGDRVFARAVGSILNQRSGKHAYPAYITDIDLSKLADDAQYADVQTVHYLEHKKRIEQRFNEILAERTTNNKPIPAAQPAATV